ncbi:MAG: phosphoribosyl-ATP diphosphatase [Pseudomonadota bacterium]
MSNFSLSDLEAIIATRAQAPPDESWTAKLVSSGIEKVGKKFGEEATELLIAALKEDDASVVGESADLLFHWLVLLHMRNVPVEAVLVELDKRTAQSGLAEKAARKK